MFNLFEDQSIDDVFSRAEQSRVSYNLQTEEFRNLNANLQTYLGGIKTIDDDNHQLQENIEQIRTSYLLTLENHLRRLPKDFRQQSQTLTDAHIERYKFKSRARRFIWEREELKRRIHFVAGNEKDQIKRLNILQRQERSVRNEFEKVNEQLQSLVKYVDNEKQTYQQALNKVDDLQIQVEQICVERSKTEFEIQTLKEEVKLMQTTKEFLGEERETIIATQTEANEYLLSRLNHSISHMREDFDQLNKNQLQQIEKEYKQMLQTLEETLITNQTTNPSQHNIPSEREQLQNEHQIVLQELTILNDHHHALSERALAMETDLYSLRNERMQELISKDNELEQSKNELQRLNEKLNHLAEYDRNLKFELTLYRGVLESEYRRKQSSNSIPHLKRPTTLRSNNNSMTDRTTWLTSSTNQNKFNGQQEEDEILTTRNTVQSDDDSFGEDTNGQINEITSTKTPSDDEKLISEESLWQQLIEPFNREQQQDKITTNIISEDTEKSSNSISTAVPIEDQQSSSRTSSISTGTRKSPSSSTPPTLREDQPVSSQIQRLPATPPELQSLPIILPSNQVASPINTVPLLFELRQSSPTALQQYRTLSEVDQASSRTSSISTGTSSIIQKFPTSSIAPTVPEQELLTFDVRHSPSTPPQEPQPSSRTSSIGSAIPSDIQRSPLSVTTPTVPEYQQTTFDAHESSAQEHQPSSRTSSISSKTSADIQTSPLTATTPAVPEQELPTSDVHQPSSRTSSISSKASADIQKSPLTATTPAVPEQEQPTIDVYQSSSRTSSIGSVIPSDIQRSPLTATTPTVPEQEQPTIDVHQPSSRTSSISSKTSADIQRSPLTATTPTVPEYQQPTFDAHDSSAQEHQPSSRTSSISSKTSADIQRSPLTATTPAVPEQEQPTIDMHQPSSRTLSIGSAIPSDIQRSPLTATTPTFPEQEQPTIDVYQSSSSTSSIGSAIPSDIQRSPLTATTPTFPEQEQPTIDVYQSSSSTSSIGSAIPSDIQRSPLTATTPTFPEQEQPTIDVYQSSSSTSSIGSAIPSDIQRSPLTATTPTVPEYQQPTFDAHDSSAQEHQPSSRNSSISSKTSADIQKSPLTATTPAVSEQDQPTFYVHQPSSRTSSISSAIPSDIRRSPLSATAPTVPEYQQTTFDAHDSSAQEHQSSSRTSSISSVIPSDIQRSPLSATTSTVPEQEQSTFYVHQPSSRTSSISSKASADIQKSPLKTTTLAVSEQEQPTIDVYQSSSRTSSISSAIPSDIQRSPLTATTPTVPEEEQSTFYVHQPSSRTSSISSKTSADIQKSPLSATTPTGPEQKQPTFDAHESSEQEHQPSSRTSSKSSKTSLDFQTYPPTVPEYQLAAFDDHQSPLTPPEDRQTLSEVQKSSNTDALTTSTDVDGKTSPVTTDGYETTTSTDEFGNENQLTKSFGETNDNLQYVESTLEMTNEKASSEIDHNEGHQSIHSIEPQSIEEFETALHTKPNESRSPSFASTSTPKEERKQNPLQSDHQSDLEQDETSNQTRREEEISSSLPNQIEENNSTNNISSAIIKDHNFNESNSLPTQDTSKQSSHNTSLIDVEEVDSSTSQKLETTSEDTDDPNLAVFTQDLRYVFHELANDEDLVEIDNDLPDKIFDRLESHDHLIRTLFESLIRKYLVQTAIQANRPETLDWIEFRDILFPLITGRYIKRHIRKLFDLFDTSKDGYLSLQEIAELLDVLHANDTIDLAQNIIDEYDTDHDGKLSVDELIEAISKTDDINEHALPEAIENKQWFNQSPIENQTITLEVPIITFSSKIDDKITQEISLLGRIFERVGANSASKQLDSHKKNLSIQITNEFLKNNINISSDDLELFIQLFLDKKQNTDSLINWIEFRDLFFPIINNGFYTKNDIKRWFDIFDTNQNELITQEQAIQLLRLLQIDDSEDIIYKLNEVADNINSWTLDELIFALENVDETASHLINNEQITSFDINWLSNNVF